jgi:hypothetical protein
VFRRLRAEGRALDGGGPPGTQSRVPVQERADGFEILFGPDAVRYLAVSTSPGQHDLLPYRATLKRVP